MITHPFLRSQTFRDQSSNGFPLESQRDRFTGIVCQESSSGSVSAILEPWGTHEWCALETCLVHGVIAEVHPHGLSSLSLVRRRALLIKLVVPLIVLFPRLATLFLSFLTAISSALGNVGFVNAVLSVPFEDCDAEVLVPDTTKAHYNLDNSIYFTWNAFGHCQIHERTDSQRYRDLLSSWEKHLSDSDEKCVLDVVTCGATVWASANVFLFYITSTSVGSL